MAHISFIPAIFMQRFLQKQLIYHGGFKKKIDTKVQILIYKSHTNFAIILQNNHEYQKCKNNYNQTVKQFTTFKKRLKSLKNLLKPLKNNFVSS